VSKVHAYVGDNLLRETRQYTVNQSPHLSVSAGSPVMQTAQRRGSKRATEPIGIEHQTQLLWGVVVQLEVLPKQRLVSAGL
jgi:hypothetical protein